MSAVPVPVSEIDTPADRAMRVAAIVLAVYLAATTWPMVLYSERSGSTGALAVHVAALLAALAVILSRRVEIRPIMAWPGAGQPASGAEWTASLMAGEILVSNDGSPLA